MMLQMGFDARSMQSHQKSLHFTILQKMQQLQINQAKSHRMSKTSIKGILT